MVRVVYRYILFKNLGWTEKKLKIITTILHVFFSYHGWNWPASHIWYSSFDNELPDLRQSLSRNAYYTECLFQYVKLVRNEIQSWDSKLVFILFIESRIYLIVYKIGMNIFGTQLYGIWKVTKTCVCKSMVHLTIKWMKFLILRTITSTNINLLHVYISQFDQFK